MEVYIILSTILVSIPSLVGVSALSIREETLHRFLIFLIAFSAGAIMGAVYFDLLPEAMEQLESQVALDYIALGFILFFILERLIYWYHGHGHSEEIESTAFEVTNIKGFVYLNLFGDAIHNFLDGLIIAASYMISFELGISTTIAVFFHEFPQEMGDYGLLVYGGLSSFKALILNFLIALISILGGAVGILLTGNFQGIGGVLIALSAGGFIYLGASELIPEIKRQKGITKSFSQLAFFLLGIIFMRFLKLIS
ncbi:MAG: ZIP family metal transporter [Candidatus Bathyarchaeia archaeon]